MSTGEVTEVELVQMSSTFMNNVFADPANVRERCCADKKKEYARYVLTTNDKPELSFDEWDRVN